MATVKNVTKITTYRGTKHLSRVKIPKYSLGEELVNSISHGVGAGLAIAGLVLCLVKVGTPYGAAAVSIYGAFMIVLYIISCLYHALSPRLLGKKVLRILDHINVLLMVAGTYMPICLSLLWGMPIGWISFGLVWLITIIAVVFNAIDVDKYQIVSVICNLLLGWGSLLLLPWLLQTVPASGIFIFLIGGGAVYSLGSILYLIGAKKKYMHCIFHFFVLAASILHFFFIYNYCI